MNSSGPSSTVVIDGQEHHLSSEGKTRVKILVVEDDASVLKTMILIFSSAGYDARGVASAEAALALLEGEEWVPQLAIMDIHLPGMNGIDLAILLRARYPKMQVSLFSGREATTDLLEEAGRNGHYFDNVLPKPTHPSVFLNMAASLESGDSGVNDA